MKPAAAGRPGTFARVFGWPAVLGVLTVIGLVSALVGDDAWDVVSCIALAIPVLVIAWHVRPAAWR
jgi:hypothetical protein